MLKILHTGDIHLDSPFAQLDARRAEIRRAELRASFSAMLAYARRSAVDLILMAGDIFDSEYASRETCELLVREFSRLRCPVVIAPGNHDCAAPDSIWMRDIFPDNVYIFRSPELTKFSFDDLHTDVYGYAFTTPELRQSPLSGHHADDPTRINLLCAHAELGAPLSRYAPLSREELALFGADYAALGHIHNAPPIEQKNRTVAAYCGCLEGRAPDEVGAKGAILAEIQKSGTAATVRAARVRFSKRRYENAEVSCAGTATLSEIEELIRQTIENAGYGEDTLLRVTLRGTTDPALVVDCAALESRFPTLFSIRITDETAPALSAADFAGDRTVRGEFYRALLPKIEHGTPHERHIAIMALRCGLAAMAGENITNI